MSRHRRGMEIEGLVEHGGSKDFWRVFRTSLVFPLIPLLWLLTVRRKTRSSAEVAGAQCGSGASLIFWSTVASMMLLFLQSPDAPQGIAVVPIVTAAVACPPLFFFGTLSYLRLHGAHRRSSLHLILSIGSAVYSMSVIIFIVVYSLLDGLWTSM